jgi:hypothetical protein
MGPVIIGIDPGLDGGIAGLKPDLLYGTLSAVTAMPTLEIRGNPRRGAKQRIQRWYDGLAIRRWISDWIAGEDEVYACIEQAQAMSRFDPQALNPKTGKQGMVVPQGAVSNFTIGGCYRYWFGFFDALGIPLNVFSPRDWQAEMLRGLPRGRDTKGSSIIACRRIYPDEPLMRNDRCRKPHDGMADALLIATHHYRSFKHSIAF